MQREPFRNPKYLAGQMHAPEHATHVTAAQARADACFKLQGLQAPPPVPHETLGDYRRRLVSNMQHYLPDDSPWKKARVESQPDGNLPVYERHIFDTAVAEFTKPAGPMRKVTSLNDENGQRITRFYGDPENCWGPFKAQARLVRFDPGLGRGANAPGANKPVGTLMSDGSVQRV
jgi:hypothetical protein